ncbi:MAG: response regulator [Oligoflexia bacterium]
MTQSLSARKSVLIIDDDPDVRAIVRENLEGISKNIVVQESPDGMDALNRVEKQKFNLVVTDLKMPKKNGVQFLEGLKQIQKSHQPDLVVVLSGCLSQEGFELPAGITQLSKPCTEQDLRNSITSVFPEASFSPNLSASGDSTTPAQQLLIELNSMSAAAALILGSLTVGRIQYGKPSAVFPELKQDSECAKIPVIGDSLSREIWLCLDRAWAQALQISLPPLSTSEAVVEALKRMAFSSQASLQKIGMHVSQAPVEPASVPTERFPSIAIPIQSSHGRAWLLVRIRTQVDRNQSGT